jgi:YbbR domain-containing protein
MKIRKNKTNQEEKTENANRIGVRNVKINTIFSVILDTLSRIYRWFSNLIDFFLLNNRYLAIVSLVAAIFLHFMISYSDEDGIFKTNLLSARELNGVSVSARYNNESFEISGLPATCNITITGDASSVNTAAVKNGYCLVNLDGYTEGTHTVPITAVGYGDAVSTKIAPSNVTVTLKKKTTVQYDISYDFINTDKLNSRYILSTPEFSSTHVNIRASEDTLNSIAFVKALIDVNGVTEDFEQEAALVAYDSNGQPVNADISPNTIKCSVKVSSPNKTVPIILSVTGTVPNDMAISSTYMDHQSVTIYGTEANLANISYVTVDLDASTLSKDTKVVLPITLPSTVTGSDITRVNLEVTLSEKVSKTINGIPISVVNYNNDYNITVENNKTTVAVEVSGTSDNISSVGADNIYVFIDLDELGPGTYELPLTIETTGNSYVSYELLQKTVNITISSTED